MTKNIGVSEVLDKKEVADYLRELIFKKGYISPYFIAIDIDARFNINLTQKKGWDAGEIRDDRLYRKLVKLDNKIRYGKGVKKKSIFRGDLWWKA